MPELDSIVDSMNRGDFLDYRDSRETLAVRSMETSEGETGYEVVIRPTLICNYGCSHCFLFSENISLNRAGINRLINSFSRLNNKNTMFVISGGEPTLHPMFPELVKGLRNKADTLMIQTNGSALRPRILEQIPEDKDILFFVSFPSHLKDRYNQITKSSSFDKTTEILRKVSERYRLILNYVLMGPNHQDLLGLVDFVADTMNIKNTTIQLSNIGTPPAGTSHEAFLIDYATLKDEVRHYIEQARNRSVNIDFTVTGDCSFPLCFYHDIDPSILLNQSLFRVSDERISYNSYKRQFFKGNECIQCKYDKHCQGFLTNYVKKYGTHEMKAIR
ncbi:MAG: radical SAM protein [Candidatus Woesearchaeota archaeon]